MLQTVLTGILICQPITMNWDPTARGRCGDETIAFAVVSVVDIATDLVVLVLPLKPLWGLQIKLSYKIALACVFGAGLVYVLLPLLDPFYAPTPILVHACCSLTLRVGFGNHRTVIFTAVRLYFAFHLDFDDLSYSSVPMSIVSSIQAGVAIMVTSAALFRPVFDCTIGAWLGLSISGKLNSAKRNEISRVRITTKVGTESGGSETVLRSTPKPIHWVRILINQRKVTVDWLSIRSTKAPG